MQYMFALSRVECTAVVQRSFAFVLVGIIQNRNLNLSRLRFVGRRSLGTASRPFWEFISYKRGCTNRWLRTENWFNSTYWYRVRISQVTKETSFAARIHSHSVCFKFSVGRLWRNCWRITSLSLEIFLLWSLCFVKYFSLKPSSQTPGIQFWYTSLQGQNDEQLESSTRYNFSNN